MAIANKPVKAIVKLVIPVGKATPSPPIGPALGPRGVNIMDFCKKFDEATKGMEAEMPIPVVIYIYDDRSFTFIIKTPPASYLVKKEAGIQKGGKVPGREIIGKISKEKIRKVAEMKLVDMNCHSIEAAMLMISGTANSMGIEVTE